MGVGGYLRVMDWSNSHRFLWQPLENGGASPKGEVSEILSNLFKNQKQNVPEIISD